MQGISKLFNFSSSVIENSPTWVGLGAMFYLAATTFIEVSTTGVPFWSALMVNAQDGIAAVVNTGSELIHG